MTLAGRVSGCDEERRILYIAAPFDSPSLLKRREISGATVILDDGRHISTDQRKKIYATFRDISDHTGYLPDEVKAHMKYDFIAATGKPYFSLSDVDMTTAGEFLTHLIEFCLMWSIPTLDNLASRAPDISKYIYQCLFHKKCAVCGKKAELHHVDRVGMGRDRREITHTGMRAQPLCGGVRGHHQEAHDTGQDRFDEKYHIHGVPIDAEICAVWRLKG